MASRAVTRFARTRRPWRGTARFGDRRWVSSHFVLFCHASSCADRIQPPIRNISTCLRGAPSRAAQFAVAIGAPRPQRRRHAPANAVLALRQRRPQVGALGGEQAGVQLAVGRDAGAMAIAAERLADRTDEADFALRHPRTHSATRLRRGSADRARAAASARRCGRAVPPTAPRVRASQPLQVPTSMYSMKRTTWPLPRKRSTSGSTWSSLTPRCTTQLNLIAAKPGRLGRRDAGKHVGDCRRGRRTARGTGPASSASRLTVSRLQSGVAQRAAPARPAASRWWSARGRRAGDRGSRATSSGRRLRSSGSPPVRRSLCTPSRTKPRTSVSISSKRQARCRVEAVVVGHAIGGHAVRAAEIAGLDHRQAQVAQRAAAQIVRQRRSDASRHRHRRS